jgi:hypothetical protein
MKEQGYLINYKAGDVIPVDIVKELTHGYFINMYGSDIDILQSKSSIFKDKYQAYLDLYKARYKDEDLEEWAYARGLEGFKEYCYDNFPQYFV